jgi:hypothetical protein
VEPRKPFALFVPFRQFRGPSPLAGLLVAAYKRRLRGVVELVPDWVAEEILIASEDIGDDRAGLWMSQN